MLGVHADGRNELVALTDGYRESGADPLRSCRRRGMAAPVLAARDGPLRSLKALREAFPRAREQRCWFHKQANVLAGLTKSTYPGAVAARWAIYNAEDIDKAGRDLGLGFDYGAKYTTAAEIGADADVLRT
jgi:transposase-like protein